MHKFQGKLNDNYYVNPNGLAFDFTDKSDITFVLFLGGNSTPYSVKHKLDFYKKWLYAKLHKHINVVIVGDNKLDGTLFAFNFAGIKGACDSIWDLSKILYNKIYVDNGTKKTVVFGDCGGAFSGILTSTVVPYDSISFTTPYFEVLSGEQEFDTGAPILWYAREISMHVYNSQKNYSQYFDTLKFYEKFIKNPNNQLNLHWATTVKGSDLLFRNKANLLPKRNNFKIIDHNIPAHVEGHLLASYLVKTKKWYQLIIDEIKIQQSIIDTINTNYSIAG